MKTKIRKWGNSAGTIIPAPVLAEACFSLGDQMNVEAVEGKIILTRLDEGLTLKALLAGSPRECFRISDEDREWIDSRPVGREI